MAQDTLAKRRNVGSNMVAQATALLDAEEALHFIAQEKAQAGVYTDSDFDGTDLAHVIPTYHMNVLAENIVPDLETWLDQPFTTGGGVPTRRQVLLQVRR